MVVKLEKIIKIKFKTVKKLKKLYCVREHGIIYLQVSQTTTWLEEISSGFLNTDKVFSYLFHYASYWIIF